MLDVLRDPTPQEVDHHTVAIIAVDARAAQLELGARTGEEIIESELGLRIKRIGVRRREQPVRSDDFIYPAIDDHQMVTGRIEMLPIGTERDPLVEQLAVKDFIAQLQSLPEVGPSIDGLDGEIPLIERQTDLRLEFLYHAVQGKKLGIL